MAKTCPSCGYHPIGPFTDNCPICAEPVRNVRSGGGGGGGGYGGGGAPGASPVFRWLAIGGLTAVLAMISCCGVGWWRAGVAVNDFQKQMEEAKAKAEAERRERTVAVPVRALLHEFQTDPAAADVKYKGKYLEVSGVVERVGRDGNESPFVVLHGGDEAAKLRVECFFEPADDEDEDRIDRLSNGQAVVVRGEYSGRVTNVQMRGCVLGK